MRPARAAGGLAVAVLGTVLAGCSGGGQQSAVSVVRTAYSRTVASRTAHVTFTGVLHTGSSASSGLSLTVTGQGDEDLANRVARLTVALPVGAGSMEERIVGSVLYLRFPPSLAAQLPAGKPWLRIDLDAVAQRRFGSPLSELAPGGTSDPGELLSYLEGVSNGVTRVGTATVGGAPTTRYLADVDLNRAASRLPSRAAAGVRRIASLLGSPTLPVDVWVDDARRVRQVRMEMPIARPEPAGAPATTATAPTALSGTMTVTMTFGDFGEEVPVGAPPADQVVDVSGLPGYQRLLGGSA